MLRQPLHSLAALLRWLRPRAIAARLAALSLALGLLSAVALPGMARAAPAATSSAAPPAEPADAAREAMRELIQAFLARETSGLAGKVTVEIAETALPNKPRDCAQPQAFLPGGRAAWGRTTVGVRCRAPAWAIYVPVRISVEGDYLVASRPLASGTTLAEGDWRVTHGDMAAERPGVLVNAEQARGRTLRLPVPAGGALRADQLQASPVIQRGDSVQVVAQGEGFAVRNEGKALGPAADGQSVDVKLENGRVVRGIARPGRIVETR